MARRFLERGVRFVQVTHSDSEVQWDQHSNLYQGHTKNASEVDKPIAGFLRDLKARGMLDDTLVLWGGEFGRDHVLRLLARKCAMRSAGSGVVQASAKQSMPAAIEPANLTLSKAMASSPGPS